MRKIKAQVQLEFDKFKNDLGYGINTLRSDKEKQQRILKEALDNLNKSMGNLGISGGKIIQQRDIRISIDSMQYPSKEAFVNIGDEISNIKYRIKNKSDRKYDTKLQIAINDDRGSKLTDICSKEQTLEPNSNITVGPFSFVASGTLYPSKGIIYLICTLKDKIDNKELAKRQDTLYMLEKNQLSQSRRLILN